MRIAAILAGRLHRAVQDGTRSLRRRLETHAEPIGGSVDFKTIAQLAMRARRMRTALTVGVSELPIRTVAGIGSTSRHNRAAHPRAFLVGEIGRRERFSSAAIRDEPILTEDTTVTAGIRMAGRSVRH